MKGIIQLTVLSISLLLLGAIITFSSTPQAKLLTDNPYEYWDMLGKYQPNSDTINHRDAKN